MNISAIADVIHSLTSSKKILSHFWLSVTAKQITIRAVVITTTSPTSKIIESTNQMCSRTNRISLYHKQFLTLRNLGKIFIFVLLLMRGIILSGGRGTRLYPSTNVISKQLLPIFDKPMIYYPIATLMLVGIKDIIIITAPKDLASYQELLGDGSQWGLSFEYMIQNKPQGIAQAFLIAENRIKGEKVCLILGDNLFYGKLDFLRRAISEHKNATIFACEVDNPKDYGVVEFDNNLNVKRIVEKPNEFVSKYAIPGIYLFDEKVTQLAQTIKPSRRGELEITDLLQLYLERKELQVNIIGRGVAWLDTGTPSNLIDAALFIRAIEQRQGRKIGCLEEIALSLGYISLEEYKDWLDFMPNSEYKNYCLKILNEFKR